MPARSGIGSSSSFTVGLVNAIEALNGSYVTKDEITKSELDSLLNFLIENPSDTLLIPKFDFKNSNTVFVHYIINLKKENNIEELSKFKLL